MRGTRAVVVLVLALLAGIGAMVLAARWLTQQTTVSTVQVVVAARDIDLGSPLNAQMVQAVPWPGSAVPPGAFGKIEDLDGRVLKTGVMRGEPLLESKLAPVGTKGGLSAVIGAGRRAITVRVNEVVGVAGFALPGNYVDVLVNTQDERDKPISKIVLERILVLAVAQEASRDETKPKVVNAVTLEVTPEQAEKLDLARSVGTLSLVLRNQVDQGDIATTGARKGDLLAAIGAPPPPAQAVTAPPAPAPAPVAAKPRPRPAAAPPAAAPPSKETVEIIRGIQRSAAEL